MELAKVKVFFRFDAYNLSSEMASIQGPNAPKVLKQNTENKNRNESTSMEARAMDQVITPLNIRNGGCVVDYSPDL